MFKCGNHAYDINPQQPNYFLPLIEMMEKETPALCDIECDLHPGHMVSYYNRKLKKLECEKCSPSVKTSVFVDCRKVESSCRHLMNLLDAQK